MSMNLRNKPCSCHSGRKFKKCCGNEAALNTQRREAEAKQLEALQARAAERAREQEELRKAAPGAHEYRRSPSIGVAAMMAAMAFAGGGGRRL